MAAPSARLVSLRFANFKALRDTTLPIGNLTLLIGPNGSGKSTVLQGLDALRQVPLDYDRFLSLGCRPGTPMEIFVTLRTTREFTNTRTWRSHQEAKWTADGRAQGFDPFAVGAAFVSGIGVCSFRPEQIAQATVLTPQIELASSGANLAGVIDRLRDESPERFEDLNRDLNRILPEFDRVLFDTPEQRQRSLSLRMKVGGHAVPAAHLSQGTLLVLAVLTLCFLRERYRLIALEEPDHGIHPRLLREMYEALRRITEPSSGADDPVQINAAPGSN